MNSRDGRKVGARGEVARQHLKHFALERPLDRPQPVGALGMALAHLVRQAGGVTDDERGHCVDVLPGDLRFPVVCPALLRQPGESPFTRAGARGWLVWAGVSYSAERCSKAGARCGASQPDERLEADPMTAKDQEAPPFWRVKTLDEMSAAEWESLCDGCGRCCLVKLEDEDDRRIDFTDIGCKLLDAKTCRCLDYRQTSPAGPRLRETDPAAVRELSWLPVTCAYRLVAEGRDLFDWHPLVSGSPDSVHEAGVSVRGRVFASETDLAPEIWPDRVVKWPNWKPRARR